METNKTTIEAAGTSHADEYYEKDDLTTKLTITEHDAWENRKYNFIDGAKWQKEQDKIVIDKLIEALGFMCKVASAKCQFEKGKKIELKFEADTLKTWVLNTKELLNNIK